MLEHNFLAMLSALRANDVAFIVVGGLAAALDGAPVTTYDMDVVHARDAGNVKRLLAVLEDVDAIFRIQPDRRLRPAASHLAGPGHLNLITRYGPLDLLGTIGSGLGFQDLLPHSVEMEIDEGVRIRVLDLETLIAIKEQLASEKDLAALPILKRTLEEKRKLGKQ
jgi:hypothetical protein